MKQQIKTSIAIVAILLFALTMTLWSPDIRGAIDVTPSPSDTFAFVVGVLLLLLAFSIGVSLVRRTYRLEFINAADPKKARQAAIMAAITLAALGIMLTAMASVDPCSCANYRYGPVLTGLSAILYGIGGIYMWRRYDEPMRRYAMHSTSNGSAIFTPLLILWAGLSQSGVGFAFEPLGVLALALASSYAGSCWANRARLAAANTQEIDPGP